MHRAEGDLLSDDVNDWLLHGCLSLGGVGFGLHERLQAEAYATTLIAGWCIVA